MAGDGDGEVRETPLDWAGWIKSLGKQARRVREFLGLSQEQVARAAGVSQGAVSRFEGGRGLATPLLVVMKVNAALRSAVSAMTPGVLSVDACRVLELEEPTPGREDNDAPPIERERADPLHHEEEHDGAGPEGIRAETAAVAQEIGARTASEAEGQTKLARPWRAPRGGRPCGSSRDRRPPRDRRRRSGRRCASAFQALSCT
jgi:transcriptional regulator with XRE-family HTH domain